MLDRLLDTKRILVCAGPGGVGKTTTAAALAVLAARTGRRTLVCTIDPAPRLADALGVPDLSDEPRALSDDAARALGITPGGLTVVVFCRDRCELPSLEGATVLRSTDPAAAAEFVLDLGRGSAYVLVDAHRRLRYRTYDPNPAAHRSELQILVNGLKRDGAA